MICQTEIVKTIVASKADYVIAAKRKQPGLYEFIEKKFQEFSGKTEAFITSEPRGSQREKRERSLITDLSGLPNPEKWPALKTVGRVMTTVQKGENIGVFQKRRTKSKA